MEFQHELIIPNEGFPFKVFLFEGGKDVYKRQGLSFSNFSWQSEKISAKESCLYGIIGIRITPASYTHLDVYKRQCVRLALKKIK